LTAEAIDVSVLDELAVISWGLKAFRNGFFFSILDFPIEGTVVQLSSWLVEQGIPTPVDPETTSAYVRSSMFPEEESGLQRSMTGMVHTESSFESNWVSTVHWRIVSTKGCQLLSGLTLEVLFKSENFVQIICAQTSNCLSRMEPHILD
jgi:hypothetical protein